MEAKADTLFETSWEVCNKVGGIFTVVSSKARETIDHYKQNYWLIGPWFPQKAQGVFEEKIVPDELKDACNTLSKEGIQLHFGNWLVKGEPQTILVDFTEFSKQTNDIKKNLWEEYQLDSLGTEWHDFDQPVVWAYATGKVIQTITEALGKEKTVAQFHEWLSGAGLLYLRNRTNIKTIWTTHATMLGRTLSAEGRNIYEEPVNPEEEAKKRFGVWAKHQMERICAHNAHVFTTVSEITGIEAEKLLGKKPDVLLFNGLDMEKFPTFEQASIQHKKTKEKINTFLTYYFHPYYPLELSEALIYFIAGRPEFHTKGIDIFIQALGILNDQLKKERINKPIVAFLFIPGNIKNIRQQLIENRELFEDITETMEDKKQDIQQKLTEALITQKEINKKILFDEDSLEELKRKTMKFLKKGKPGISTHELYNEEQDQIVQALAKAGLNNTKEDIVKVIYYPIFLTGADGLLDLDYYEGMQGSHLGIFPSYYEPWGYTPLEAAALGVASITTDLSGFGRYLCTECRQGKYPGVFVLKRYGKDDKTSTEDLAKILYQFRIWTKQERVENKQAAKKIAQTADWKQFIEKYIQAHNLALEK
ncbi:hypothetical protein HY486_04915 [Candidatus Woesearchaeota archaeon]|nr:hypothetical protein [Candidatus Woesearchaeota archaeon]